MEYHYSVAQRGITPSIAQLFEKSESIKLCLTERVEKMETLLNSYEKAISLVTVGT